MSIFGFASAVTADVATEQASASLAEMLIRTETVSRLLAETRQDLDNGQGLQAQAPELDATERKLELTPGDFAERRPLVNTLIVRRSGLQAATGPLG